MPREDCETFLQTASFEAPYFLQTPETDEGFVAYHNRLQRPDTTAISVNSHNCRHTFKQGIFPLYAVWQLAQGSKRQVLPQDVEDGCQQALYGVSWRGGIGVNNQGKRSAA